MLIKKFWKLYPVTKGRTSISSSRVVVAKEIRKKLQKFGKDYFDGSRNHGYGGYYYNKKFFKKIVHMMVEHYKLKDKIRILDVGCAKGFMLYEFKKKLPKAEVHGIDISRYCKINAMQEVKKNIKVGCCSKLPYPDNFFDFVVSISTIHNLNLNGIKKSIKEIVRVSKNKSFIRVKAYTNKNEKKFIDKWNLVAKSNLSKKKWLELFKNLSYEGDFDFSNF